MKFFVLFASLWWVIFYMALPFGVKVPEKKEEGFADSAPQNPLLLKKIIYTTILSFIISLAIIYAMTFVSLEGIK